MSEPCKPKRYAHTVVPDALAEKEYESIVARAAQFGLVVSAYGGVATLAIPSEQRRAHARANVLEAIEHNECKMEEQKR